MNKVVIKKGISKNNLLKLIIFLFAIFSFLGISYAVSFLGGSSQISSLEKGLVAHYPLDSISGTKDITPNSNHGTNYGAVLSTGIKGENGGSMEFETGERISITGVNLTNDSSFCGWGNSNSWAYSVMFFSCNSATYSGPDLYFTSSTVTWNTGDGGSNPFKKSGINVVQPSLNEWHYYCVVNKPELTKTYLYLDGEFYGEAVFKNPIQTNRGFTIANYYPGATGYAWRGKVADFRIYNRQLSENEIKLLYDSYKPKTSSGDLNKGLVGHWKLDSENGAKDSTPNGNDGTANGGITVGGTTDRKGKTGGATDFDGVDDYIETQANPIMDLGTTLSVSCWFYRETSGDYESIFNHMKKSSFYDGYWIGSMSDGKIMGFIGPYTNEIRTTNIISNNVWHHAVLWSNGTVFKIYIDGILASAEKTVGEITTTNVTSRIGRSDNPSQLFEGSISDVRVYNRALSTDEIKLLYDQYKPKEASIGSLNKGLVLDMPLTTKHMKSNTKVSDLTPYGNDGTVSGAIVGSQYTSFDGVDDKIILNNDIKITSISMWANFWNVNTTSYFMGNLGTTMGVRYNGTSFLIFNNGDNWKALNWTKVNKFVNLIIVRINNTSNYDCYIDGVKIGSTYAGDGNLDVLINQIGIRGVTDFPFNGSISNVKIWNRALSEAEVKLLYEKGRS